MLRRSKFSMVRYVCGFTLAFGLGACDSQHIPPAALQPPPNPEPITSPEPLPPVEGPVTYEIVFARVLEPKCSKCHNEKNAEGFVDVTNLEDMRDNFALPELLVKGNPEKSDLYKVVRKGEMPPKAEALPEDDIELIGRWIREGSDL